VLRTHHCSGRFAPSLWPKVRCHRSPLGHNPRPRPTPPPPRTEGAGCALAWPPPSAPAPACSSPWCSARLRSLRSLSPRLGAHVGGWRWNPPREQPRPPDTESPERTRPTSAARTWPPGDPAQGSGAPCRIPWLPSTSEHGYPFPLHPSDLDRGSLVGGGWGVSPQCQPRRRRCPGAARGRRRIQSSPELLDPAPLVSIGSAPAPRNGKATAPGRSPVRRSTTMAAAGRASMSPAFPCDPTVSTIGVPAPH
jgi:hypothetical protein